MSTIIRLGNAQLRVIGLNPQRLSDESETRLPGHATFLGMAYQKTGTGEHSITLEVMTVPHILGGLDALGWLRAHHKAQDTVNYWRMENHYSGRREGEGVITTLFSEEERFHPFNGYGRMLNAEIGLIIVGD